MSALSERLADRIDMALSGTYELTGEACKHGYDRAVCPSVECDNPYALEPLLREAARLLRATPQPDKTAPVSLNLSIDGKG